MNNSIFKGALLGAVAAACGYASAATIAPIAGGAVAKNVSLEGATVSTSALGAKRVAAVGVSVTTSVSHFAGDEWQLTLSKGTWSTTGATSVSVACTSGNIVLDQIPTYSSDGKSLTFTVAGTSGTTSAQSCDFASLGVHGPSLSAGAVTVSFAAKRPSSASFDRDLTTTDATLFSVGSQLGSISVLSAFNGVVDYQGSAGKGFATDDGGVLGGKEDTLSIKLAASSTGTDYSMTGNGSLTLVLNAESGKKFSFLDANGDGTCSAAELTTTASGLVEGSGITLLTIDATCSSVTFLGAVSIPGTGAGDTTVSIAMGSRFASPSVGTSGGTITPMTFPSTSSASLVSSTSALKSNTAISGVGAWTSNGSTVTIPYMPVNTVAASRIAPVVYITNRSLVSGPATASMRNESGVLCEASLGTIEANRTTNVSNAINDAVKSCYNTSSAAEAAGHRLSITITASLPSADTEVYSAFTVGGTSRVSVVNSSNGK